MFLITFVFIKPLLLIVITINVTSLRHYMRCKLTLGDKLKIY